MPETHEMGKERIRHTEARLFLAGLSFTLSQAWCTMKKAPGKPGAF
jgi:hypothetical protein